MVSVSDLYAGGFGTVRVCGPPEVRRGLRYPKTFGGLVDEALGLGDDATAMPVAE